MIDEDIDIFDEVCVIIDNAPPMTDWTDYRDHLYEPLSRLWERVIGTEPFEVDSTVDSMINALELFAGGWVKAFAFIEQSLALQRGGRA